MFFFFFSISVESHSKQLDNSLYKYNFESRIFAIMVALVSSHNIFLSCVSLARKGKKNNKLTLQNEEETTETSGLVAPSPGCYYHHHYYYHCCSAQKEFVAADLHALNGTVT